MFRQTKGKMVPLHRHHNGLAPADLPGSRELPPLAIPPLPRHLLFPLIQSRGMTLIPRVEPGQPVLKGQLLAEHPDHPPLHASSSGVVATLDSLPLATGPYLVITTDGRDMPVVSHLVNPPPVLTPKILLDRIWQAGITGLGGAGFPTTGKLDSAGIDTLILNGAECEPLSSCDQTLLARFPHRVLAGARLLLTTFSIRRCLLAIEADKTASWDALNAAVADSGDHSVQIVRVPARYPAGGEKQLIQALTGMEVPHGGHPQNLGLVCLNVATVAAIHDAIHWNSPLISRLVTLTGQGIRQPHNLWVRLGTPVSELIEYCGGYTGEAVRLVQGGVMMGYPLASDQLPVTKSTHCIWVGGSSETVEVGPEQPCIRCGACVDVCPAGLLPQELYRHAKAGQREQAMALHLAACIECGCCDVVCPSHIPLVRQFQTAKRQQAEWLAAQNRANHAKARYQARLARKAREEQARQDNARRSKESIQDALARLKTRQG